ncbi:hypothetical protein R6Q59_006676 [Mikania micrantha]
MMDMKTLIVALVDDYTQIHMRHCLNMTAAMMMSQLLADEGQLPLPLYLNQETVSKFVLSKENSVIKEKLPVLLEKLCRLSGPIPGQLGKIYRKRMKTRCLSVSSYTINGKMTWMNNCWVKFMKRKVKDLLSRAREGAKKVALKADVEVGDDLSVIIPYKPRWMGSQIWEKLVEYWNTDDWKAKSSINVSNRGKLTGGKHTLGSQTYVTLKRKADKLLGRPATVDEIWMHSHGKIGTRPLDKLLISKGGEGQHEAGNLDDIDLQDTVKWVDTRAKDSLKSYKEHVKKRYGDDARKQPLFDPDSWIQAVGGRKKGRVYGFSDISDPHVVMTDTPSTPTNEQYSGQIKWVKSNG